MTVATADDIELDAKKVLDFLATARKRFAAAAEDERELRDKFNDDLRFASPDGEDQWDVKLKQERDAARRPALTFPRCHIFVQQVSNEARQNKPQVKYAVSDGGDKDTADVMEGLARYIQYSSDAQVAYETAVEYSAGGSFGYYRFLTDYCDDDSDDLDLKIVPVLDPTTIYGRLVPAIFGRQPKYWFVVEDIPKDEFKLTYPDSDLASLTWSEAEDGSPGWIGSETVRIAEYWWVEEKRTKGKRRPEITIKMCKTNGFEILPGNDGETSETTWPGTKCNIIPVLGKQMIREGKPKLSSVVRPQKSAQQLINYSKSRIAETLAQSPVSPWIAVEGQLAGYEQQWMASNTNPVAALMYKAVDVAGRPAPPPQRQVYEPPIQSLSGFIMQEIDDMKATTGIYDASLGSQGNETSGKGILARQQQTNLSTMHFMDNLERSFKQAGEVMGELIPKIYDAARTIKILGPDEAQKVVQINQQHKDENGKDKHYDLAGTKGSWVVTMGRSYSSKRMESFDMMQSVLASQPGLINVIGDIFFGSSDLAGADQMAERFKKMLPPNLQDQGDGEQIPPQAQAAIQQLQQAHQALNAHAQNLEKQLGQMQFEKTAKTVEHQGKLEEIAAKYQADMALEDKKLLAQITIAEIGTKAQIVSDREADRRALEAQFHDQAHDVALAAVGHQQAQDMAAQQAGHQQDAAAQQADAQSQQSAQDAAQSQAQQEQAAQQQQDGQ